MKESEEMRLISKHHLWVILLVLSSPLTDLLLAGDDILILKNGDRITGEIKKLERGNIHIDADYGDNVFIIEWEEVERVESSQNFVVQTSRGKRLSGSIQTDASDSSRVLVEDAGGTVPVEQEVMVSIQPVDEGFWGRFGASIDFGLSLTKANETKQLSTRATADYLGEDWSVAGNWDVLRNTRTDVPDTRRTEAGGNFRYFMTDRWYGIGFGNFLQSDELELDLRSTIGGGAGRYLVQTNQWYLSLMGGAAWTNENFFDDPESVRDDKNSGEAFGGAELNGFNLGDLSIQARFIAFPSLTESGRVRMDFSTDFKYDLPKDLYFSIGFTTNLDTAPPGDTPKNDYIFNTAVGWSY